MPELLFQDDRVMHRVAAFSANSPRRQFQERQGIKGLFVLRDKVWFHLSQDKNGLLALAKPRSTGIDSFRAGYMSLYCTSSENGLYTLNGRKVPHRDFQPQAEVVTFSANTMVPPKTVDVDATFAIKDSRSPSNVCVSHVGSITASGVA